MNTGMIQVCPISVILAELIFVINITMLWRISKKPDKSHHKKVLMCINLSPYLHVQDKILKKSNN